jgi:hypothetical protein
MSDIEEWRAVVEFPNYGVSNLGNVRRTKAGKGTRAGKILKPRPNKGYLGVGLYKEGGKRHTRAIHRLVALAFIPNPLNLPEVNHVKGKQKWNNTVGNLEWSTPSGNMQHAYDTGLKVPMRGESNGSGAKLTWEQVTAIRASTGKSQRALAKEYGVSQTVISHIVRGKTWKQLPPKKTVVTVSVEQVAISSPTHL